MNHLDENQIRRFVHNLAPLPEQIKINRHLVDCPECMEKVQGLNYLRENPDEVMDSFNIDSLEELQRGEFLRKIFGNEMAETQDASWKEKLQQGLADLWRKTGLTFQTFQNAASHLTTITSLKAPDGYQFEQSPFDYTEYVPVRGKKFDEDTTIQKLRAEAEQNLINGDIPGIETALLKIVALEPDVYRKCRMFIAKDYKKLGFIETDSGNQQIGVYLSAEFGEAAADALVVLIPGQKNEKPVIKPLVSGQVDGEDYYLALFEDLPGNIYSILISGSFE